MVFVLYFDNYYFHWAKPLTESIKIHEPKSKIQIYSYNLKEEQIEDLRLYSNVTEVINKSMKYDPHISETYNGRKIIRFMMTCRKGEHLLRAMEKYPDEKLFVVMDVDMLLVRPLNDLKKQMRNKDIGLMRVGPGKVMGTFLAAKSTRNGKHFLSDFNKAVMDGILYLCKDQKTLSTIYEGMKNKINFLLLTRQYIDHASTDDSYIWSAHKSKYGSKKERFKVYEDKLKLMKVDIII